MTAVALIVGAVGVALIWGAITNRDPLTEAQRALSGKRITPPKGFAAPKSQGTSGLQAPAAGPPKGVFV